MSNLRGAGSCSGRAEGFFDTFDINGVPTSIMGCIQTVEFGAVEGEFASGRLQDFERNLAMASLASFLTSALGCFNKGSMEGMVS